ncbi:hypothetical protein Tco_0750675 [Tanacetum coccineum]|uniref:Uncharacterized protein n=1 Tax=Tanacetum coccineum TaxID=301880 RepID=A0ABQ4Z1X2_9ASTR
MASFDYRLNPLYTIKECSSCGALYTTDYCCSNVGLVDKIVRDPNPISYDETPDSPSQPLDKIIRERPPQNCATCGDPVDGLYDEHLDTIPVTESDEVIKSSVEELVPIPSKSEGISDSVCDVPLCDNPTPLKAFKDHSEIVVDSNDDSSSSDDDFFSSKDIEYVDASPPDAEIVSLKVVDIVIPKVRGIDTDILLTIKDDILREKLLNVNLLIAKIKALKDNPTPSSNVMTKSSSTSPNFFLKETNTVDNSLPKTETFCFNQEEISSGSPTSYSDLSLPDYEAFYLDDDHVEEKSSGSTTTHADFSQYDSFIFDLSNDSFPPADRSDFYHEEFADELAHIISPSEYDCFYIKSEPDPGELTSIVDSGIRENVISMTNGFSDSNDDSTSIDDDSFAIDDIDYVEASPPDFELVSLEVDVEYNPTPSSDFVTKSPSTFPNFFLEETNTFDNSLPESETFCFDLEENSMRTTTCSDYSLPDYEVFYLDDDHIEEKSSGSTTTHSDISLSKYDSFIFDLSNDPFPPANRSDFYHREFAYELAHTYHHRVLLASIKIRVSPIRDCLGFLKPLVLAVLSFVHSSFKSSASFGNPIS